MGEPKLEITLRDLKEILSDKPADRHPYKIGENYVFRSVTMIDVGEVVDVYPGEVVIKNASWIADTARWNEFLRDGKTNEVEPYPEGDLVIVNRGALIEAVRWNHPLPRDVK